MSNNKKFVIEANFIEEANMLNLSLHEFLLLMYFENSDDSTFDLDKISNKLKIDKNSILEAYDKLLSNNIITLIQEKDELGRRTERVSLDNFYKSQAEIKKEEKKEKLKEDIFSTFEKEFKRPLSSMEVEIIKAWLDKMYSEELILEALKEAVYNGATNIRYVDTILYEWNKNNLKTKEDVEKHLQNRYKEKKLEDTALYDYNWLEDNDK
jgi:DNA replication protein